MNKYIFGFVVTMLLSFEAASQVSVGVEGGLVYSFYSESKKFTPVSQYDKNTFDWEERDGLDMRFVAELRSSDSFRLLKNHPRSVISASFRLGYFRQTANALYEGERYTPNVDYIYFGSHYSLIRNNTITGVSFAMQPAKARSLCFEIGGDIQTCFYENTRLTYARYEYWNSGTGNSPGPHWWYVAPSYGSKIVRTNIFVPECFATIRCNILSTELTEVGALASGTIFIRDISSVYQIRSRMLMFGLWLRLKTGNN